MKIKPNMPNIRRLGLESAGAQAACTRTADEIARRAASRMGWAVGSDGDDTEGLMRREDDDTPNRARSAVLAMHPNPNERKAGREALRSAMGGES